jgi:hypothetical protein
VWLAIFESVTWWTYPTMLSQRYVRWRFLIEFAGKTLMV